MNKITKLNNIKRELYNLKTNVVIKEKEDRIDIDNTLNKIDTLINLINNVGWNFLDGLTLDRFCKDIRKSINKLGGE